MHSQTKSSSILIEKPCAQSSCVVIKCDSEIELIRLFGSLRIEKTDDLNFPYKVTTCKQEYADALLLLIKEIDYDEFFMSRV